jgi:hypothetical protein
LDFFSYREDFSALECFDAFLGMEIFCPGLIKLPSMPLAFLMVLTLTPFSSAMSERVSPALTVWLVVATTSSFFLLWRPYLERVDLLPASHLLDFLLFLEYFEEELSSSLSAEAYFLEEREEYLEEDDELDCHFEELSDSCFDGVDLATVRAGTDGSGTSVTCFLGIGTLAVEEATPF